MCTAGVLHSGFFSLASSRIVSIPNSSATGGRSFRKEVEAGTSRRICEVGGDPGLRSSAATGGVLGGADIRSPARGVVLERGGEYALALDEKVRVVAGADLGPSAVSGRPGGEEAFVAGGKLGVVGAERVALVIVGVPC